MNVKHKTLKEFEADHCMHWALPVSIQSLVSLLSLLLRVIMWENLRYHGGRILSLCSESHIKFDYMGKWVLPLDLFPHQLSGNGHSHRHFRNVGTSRVCWFHRVGAIWVVIDCSGLSKGQHLKQVASSIPMKGSLLWLFRGWQAPTSCKIIKSAGVKEHNVEMHLWSNLKPCRS